jgi:hypothetical protein
MNKENAFILVTLCGDIINWDFATTFGAIQISRGAGGPRLSARALLF